jgi:hypothetical protein
LHERDPLAARQRIAFMNQLNALSNRVEYYALGVDVAIWPEIVPSVREGTTSGAEI